MGKSHVHILMTSIHASHADRTWVFDAKPKLEASEGLPADVWMEERTEAENGLDRGRVFKDARAEKHGLDTSGLRDDRIDAD